MTDCYALFSCTDSAEKHKKQVTQAKYASLYGIERARAFFVLFCCCCCFVVVVCVVFCFLCVCFFFGGGGGERDLSLIPKLPNLRNIPNYSEHPGKKLSPSQNSAPEHDEHSPNRSEHDEDCPNRSEHGKQLYDHSEHNKRSSKPSEHQTHSANQSEHEQCYSNKSDTLMQTNKKPTLLRVISLLFCRLSLAGQETFQRLVCDVNGQHAAVKQST